MYLSKTDLECNGFRRYLPENV